MLISVSAVLSRQYEFPAIYVHTFCIMGGRPYLTCHTSLTHLAERTTLCISLVCGPRRQRQLCRQQLMLDAGGLWPECLDM